MSVRLAARMVVLAGIARRLTRGGRAGEAARSTRGAGAGEVPRRSSSSRAAIRAVVDDYGACLPSAGHEPWSAQRAGFVAGSMPYCRPRGRGARRRPRPWTPRSITPPASTSSPRSDEVRARAIRCVDHRCNDHGRCATALALVDPGDRHRRRGAAGSTCWCSDEIDGRTVT